MSRRFYYRAAGELNRRLKQAVPGAALKRLHRKSPLRHFLIAGRQLALLIGLPLLIYHVATPWVWIPASVLLGFVVFSFTVLVHEAVHKCIFNRDRWGLTERLGVFYGLLSGLSYGQFKRWHLDHHDELGTTDGDPKRAYLSPKRNARWYKLLYCTPFLFPLYFRAAKRAAQANPRALRRRMRWERLGTTAFHLGIFAWFLWLSPWFAVKAWVIPVIFIFPIAFTVNRLGQHYIIDPDDVAKWSTLMRPNPVWNFLYLFSSYHLEHHYFPAVPFYNLKALQRELEPFFAERGIKARSYTQLLKLWYVDNHRPHTAPATSTAVGTTTHPFLGPS
jgi:fatty acid desaturase